MPEYYVSFDIETNGPALTHNSMIQLGAAVLDAEGKVFSTFNANLAPLPFTKPDPKTMEWWREQIARNKDLQEIFDNNIPPEQAIKDFLNWIQRCSSSLAASPVPICYPAGFDWPFLKYYIDYFQKNNPFGFRVLDIKSYAMVKLGKPFKSTVKRNMPKHWFDTSLKHTHNAVDDAIEQAVLFYNMQKDV